MSLKYIEEYYGVTAIKGRRVRYSGNRRGPPIVGDIVGSSGAHIRVLFPGEKMPVTLHPTWEVEYLPDAAERDYKEGESESTQC